MPTDMCVEGEKGGEGREEEKRDRDSWQAITCLRMGIRYTRYLDNDVYVDDVLDDEAGTDAYWCSGPHTHCEGTDDHRQSFYPELGIPSLRNIDHWMHHSQSPVSRTSLSTAWRMLQESVSKRMLSSECLYAEPFTWSPQSLPSFEPSNVLLHEGSTKCHGPPCRDYS